jgi:hypothetical protein
MKQIDLHFNSFYLASQFKTKFSLNFNENKTNITLNLQKDEFNKKMNKIIAEWYKYFPNTKLIRKGDELTILKNNNKFSIQFDYQEEKLETYDKFYVFRLFADSANVDAIQYDTEKEELDIRFNDGDTYRYFKVDYDTFEDVWKGRASCITSGENAYGAWFVGKRPSVGAALHKFLVKRNVRYTKL